MVDKELTFDNIIKNNLSGENLRRFNKIYYGREDHNEIPLRDKTISAGREKQIDIASYSFHAAVESRKPRIIKIGLIQHSIVLPTTRPVTEQRNAVYNKVREIIKLAAIEKVNIVCLQEAWAMPFFLCTRQKEQWLEFVESPEDGFSTRVLAELAKTYKMVIISPILEKDGDRWWNTAVVIDQNGEVMGKHRKNHLPSVGSFSETSYYDPGNLGHPVFDTIYGKIAINICYGRHQALNWLMFAVNGAEVVFNPAATISEFGESFWGIEARNAAISNNYFTCSINRVGTEEFYVKDKNNTVSKITRSYYGSSYITAPDGSRTPSLSKCKDGLLIGEVDLNLCRQMKDRWSFNMTARLDLYAKSLKTVCNKTTNRSEPNK